MMTGARLDKDVDARTSIPWAIKGLIIIFPEATRLGVKSLWFSGAIDLGQALFR